MPGGRHVSLRTVSRAVFVSVIALATACGTTTPVTSPHESYSTTGAAVDSGIPDLGGATVLPSSGLPVVVPRPAAHGNVIGGGTTREPEEVGSTPAAVSSTARRVLEIGFLSFDALDYQAFGVKGQSTGNTRAFIDIMVSYVNRTGGLAGHPIRAVVHNIDVAQSLEKQYAAACANFTYDHHVFAVATVAQTTLSFRACLARRGVAFAGASLSNSGAEEFSSYPGFFQADTANLDVVGRTLVTGLADAGYFTSRGGQPMRIGLLHTDSPAFNRAVARSFEPALKARGLKLDARASYPSPDSTADAGGMGAAMSNAELRFSTDHITHVLVLEQQGALSGAFMSVAEGQQYRPAYGLTSQSLLQSSLALNYPATQQSGAMAVGWLPAADVIASDQGSNPARTRCLQVLRAGGQTFADANAEIGALAYCDSALLLQAAANRATGPLTLRSLISGVEALGGSYRSPSTFASVFGTHRHDAADRFRIVHFVDACGCYRYRPGISTFRR